MVVYEHSCTAQAKPWRLNGARCGTVLLVLALALGVPDPAAADDASAATAANLETAARRAPAAMRSAPWLVVATRGANRYRVVGGIPNVWQPLARGIRLRPGSVVESGGAGHIELFNGHDTVTVAPGSRIALPRNATGDKVTTIVQDSGTVRYAVESWRLPSDLPSGLGPESSRARLARDWANHRFEVRTPALGATAKGTAFSIKVVTEVALISVGGDRLGDDGSSVATAKAKDHAGRGQTAASDAPTGLAIEGTAMTLAATNAGSQRRQPWFKSLL